MLHRCRRLVSPPLRCLVFTLILSGIAARQSLAQVPAPLFAATTESTDVAPDVAGARVDVVRTRVTRMHIDLLKRALSAPAATAAPFTLNVFDDASFAVQMERVEDSGFGHRSWGGHLAGRPLSTVVLTLRGDRVNGLVTDGATGYEITSVDGGLHRIEQVDLSVRPAQQDLVIAPESVTAPAHDPDLATPAAISTVDLFLHYTSGLLAERGLDTVSSQAARWVAETNLGFQRSGINGEIRLVGLREIAIADEQTAAQTFNAFMAHPVAQQTLANVRPDLMGLLVRRMPDYCGVASVGSTDPGAVWAVMHANCEYYSFAHEIGHTLGAQHAADDPVQTGPPFPAYARAYKAPNRAFRTVMAYDCFNPACPIVLNFSNPGVGYGGQPTGVVNVADNARRINELFPSIAAYRQTVPLPPSAPIGPSAQIVGHAVALSWQPPAAGPVSSYVIVAGSQSGRTDLGAFRFPASTTSINVALPLGAYWARVYAENANGSGPLSREVHIYVGAPTPPQGLSASVAGRTVTLTWTPPGFGGVVTGYLLDAGSLPGTANLFNGLPLSPQTSLRVENVPPGRYFVRLRAMNPINSSFWSNEVTVDVAPPCAYPSAPALQATVSDRRLSLNWSVPSGAAPFRYLLQAGGSPDSADYFSGQVTGNTIAAEVPPATYFLRVFAINSCGVSGWSNRVSVSVP